jgi:hypothetical protein
MAADRFLSASLCSPKRRFPIRDAEKTNNEKSREKRKTLKALSGKNNVKLRPEWNLWEGGQISRKKRLTRPPASSTQTANYFELKIRSYFQ